VNPELDVSGEASLTAGNAPLDVVFTGNVSGGTPPYSYVWDFGDGGAAGTPIAVHTYEIEGVYQATLTAYDNVGGQSTSNIITITVSPELIALASADLYEGVAPLTVTFDGGQDGGTPPYTYLWEFGDVETSTDEDPTHTFAEAGEYVVTFTVTDATTDFDRATIVISVRNASPDDDNDTSDDDDAADDDAVDDDAADDDQGAQPAGDDDSGGGCGC
jgi:PKD repeat protein